MINLEYEVGKRIRHYRQKAGLTQKELGEKVGLNESTIRNYELCNRTPDLDTLIGIADALKVSYYALKMPPINVLAQVMHIFFEMEDLFRLKPIFIGDETNESVGLFFDTERIRELFGEDPFADEPHRTLSKEEEDELFSLSPNPDFVLKLESMVASWGEVYEDLEDGLIDKETYESWKEKYPAFAGFNEDGEAEIFEENQSLIPISIPGGDPNRVYYAQTEISPLIPKDNLIGPAKAVVEEE